MRVTLILPVRNESEALTRNFPRIYAAMKRLGTFEIIIAENGRSSDGTVAIAQKLSKMPHVRFLSTSQAGKGGALKMGIAAAKGSTIGYTDADLAYSLSMIPIAVSAVENGNKVVIGSRREKGSSSSRPPLRYAASTVYNWTVKAFLGSKIRDHQCGFKFFDARFIKTAARHTLDTRWFFDTELLLIAQRQNIEILALPARCNERRGSKLRRSDVIYFLGSVAKSAISRPYADKD